MEDSIRGDTYQEAKRKAKEFYSKIGRIWCPAFGDYVSFNNIGFRHLLRKRGKRRSNGEQKRRFALLRCTTVVLSGSDLMFVRVTKNVVEVVEREGKKESKLMSADFWTFKGFCDGRAFTVLVRRVGNGQKHFFSVY